MRIVTTADIFDALTADRPHRKAMPVNQALSIMSDMVGREIDPTFFDTVRQALKRADAAIAA